MMALNKNHRLEFAAVFALLFVLAPPLYAEEEPVAVLSEISGTVLINSRGSWGVKPEVNLPLYSGDRVVTRVGSAKVLFSDGAVLDVQKNSNLIIQEREQTRGIAQKVNFIERRVLLFLGKLNFKTGKSNIETRFETTKAVIGIRGTAGILSIGPEGNTYIFFSEGGAKYFIGDFIKGVAPEVRVELADQNPIQRAAFLARAAAGQAEKTAEKVRAGVMPQVQLDLARAIEKEVTALEKKTAAESLLGSPDETVQSKAKEQIAEAEEAIRTAKLEEQKAIDNGADPQFRGFSSDEPGFDVPANPSLLKKSGT
jgi:hypothetical protein